MHELYLWCVGPLNISVLKTMPPTQVNLLLSRPFADAVHAGAGNIMCSYNRVNNSYGCANSYTLNHLLKTELGFQG